VVEGVGLDRVLIPCAVADSVTDDSARERFAVSMDGAMAKLEYETDRDRLLLLHTEVPEAFWGQGVGGRLVEEALAKARVENLTIVPWCPYARRWLKEHPEQIGGVTVDFKTPPPKE
jgi:predicted GNAT family acetyltransferase